MDGLDWDKVTHLSAYPISSLQYRDLEPILKQDISTSEAWDASAYYADVGFDATWMVRSWDVARHGGRECSFLNKSTK